MRGERYLHPVEWSFRKTPSLERLLAAVVENELRHDVHLADRGAFDEAARMIERLGIFAGSEAARLADQSRDLGNVVHFCRWRQIERMIVMLADEEVTGVLH
jgi:hypothetical protein